MSAKQLPSRRTFIKEAAAFTAGFSIVPRHVLGGEGIIAPSERLTFAVVGCGGMGTSYHVKMNYARLLAVCDVDEKHLATALKVGGEGVKGYRDFREVLQRDDIDIINIATPPHWHGLIAQAAARAGKDIWCEKPLTRTIGEGQKLVEAVQSNGRMLRINTWFRFRGGLYGFGTDVRPVKKLVDSGMLGWPLKIVSGVGQGFGWKHFWSGKPDYDPQAVPAELDYDMWLGPAPVKPYHPHRVHATFRGYWDYDGGGLGDMGQHYLDPVQYAIGKDDTSPVEIEAEGSQQHPDAVGAWGSVRMKYADGCEIILDGDGRYNDLPFIEGPEGKLYKGFRSDIADLDKKLREVPEPAERIADFAQSVRQRKQFALNEQNGHRSCTLVNLAKIAIRLRQPLRFDPVAQRFIDDEQANRLVNQPMRGQWQM